MNVFHLQCVQCDAEFTISEEDLERYHQMGFDLPQRCPACRRHKRKDTVAPQSSRHNQKKRDYQRKYV